MLISIIGLGFVGSAISKSFKKKKIKLIEYDKYKNIGSFNECLKSDIAFLCLPTLFNEKTSSYNKDAIHEICQKFNENYYNKIIVIKSTIEPETLNILSKKYKNLHLIHNPEFLSAKTAFADFHNQKHIVLGKGLNCSDKNYDIIINFYKKYYPDAQVSLCNSTESESMKIFLNSYYATKIQFFNELFLLCQKNKTNYNVIKDLMLKNNWINPMHTQVPGHDGKLSYGGACFPKDTKALNMYMEQNNVPNKVLKSVIDERELIRENL